jgi:hypothetical protein
MSITSILTNKSLSAEGVMNAFLTESVADVHSEIFCSALDQGMDPGQAADVAADAIKGISFEGLEVTV